MNIITVFLNSTDEWNIGSHSNTQYQTLSFLHLKTGSESLPFYPSSFVSSSISVGPSGRAFGKELAWRPWARGEEGKGRYDHESITKLFLHRNDLNLTTEGQSDHEFAKYQTHFQNTSTACIEHAPSWPSNLEGNNQNVSHQCGAGQRLLIDGKIDICP